jgi:REP element-mobilizing transposase RayT
MPSGLRRRYGQRHLHFITCSCYRRLPLFASARSKNLFVKILGEVRDRYGFFLVGYVVMPEHIHLLIGEPAKGTPSTVMQVLKQRVSRRMRRKARRGASPAQLTLLFGRSDHFLPQFWQSRFYDFTVTGSTWSPPETSMESKEIRRETSLHAHESSEAKTGRSSQRLALEQFLVLRDKRSRFDPHRSAALIFSSGQEPRPSQFEGRGTPNSRSKAGPPALCHPPWRAWVMPWTCHGLARSASIVLRVIHSANEINT